MLKKDLLGCKVASNLFSLCLSTSIWNLLDIFSKLLINEEDPLN